MLGHIFIKAKKKPTIHLGGIDLSFGNFLIGKSNYFITEACEYKANFLQIKPTTVTIMNMDFDHGDFYKNKRQLISAYRKFAKSARENVFMTASDRNINNFKNAVTYATERKADYEIRKLKERRGKCRFYIYERGGGRIKIHLRIIGKYNAHNALAAYATARHYGIKPKIIKKALWSFRGIERRMEYIGKINGAEAYADYAHHPNEIKAALAALKKLNKNLVVIFQPHTYSRTRLLMDEFVSAFRVKAVICIYSTYSAREDYDESGSALTLCENLSKHKHCNYFDDISALKHFLHGTVRKKDAVVFMGAGNIYNFAKDIAQI